MVVFDRSKNVVVVGLARGDDGCVMRQSNAHMYVICKWLTMGQSLVVSFHETCLSHEQWQSKAYFGVDYVRDADSKDDEEEDEDDSAHADVDPQSISTSVGGEVLQVLAYDIQIPVYKTKNTIRYLSEHEENMKRNKLVSPKTGTITVDNASLGQVQHTPDREQSGSPVRSLSSPMAAA
ncbi:hypothetical protein E3N88_25963 [Mikania micrantha]|uniref:Uncharacterized protein n=1 Tax=Mikania micrantha TaxID=192012 RepID=A0A5N6N6D1_9ASTR|nr:hypothetical protein E3N88_25963 [Mikania micrantha]